MICTVHLRMRLLLLLTLIPGRSSGDELRIAVPYLPPAISPLVDDPIGQAILANISVSLTRMTPNGVRLSAARSVTSEENARVWSVGIRPGWRFQPGLSLTPELVRRSFDYYRFNLSNFSRLTDGCAAVVQLSRVTALESIQQIEVEGLDRVVFRLRDPREDFDRTALSLPILNTDVLEAMGSEVGTGTLSPYFGQYTVVFGLPNKRLRLVANGLEGEAGFAAVEFHVISNALGALGALRAGNVDMVIFTTNAQKQSLIEDPTISVLPFPLEHTVPCRQFWSESAAEIDMLDTKQVLVRRSLSAGVRAASYFDLADFRYASVVP